jgi:hypothetical protein
MLDISFHAQIPGRYHTFFSLRFDKVRGVHNQITDETPFSPDGRQQGQPM